MYRISRKKLIPGMGVRLRKSREKKNLECYIYRMSSMNQILQEANDLPEDQRFTLVHRLLLLNEPGASKDVEHAWDIEIRDRVARYDRGETYSRSAVDVFSDVEQYLKP